MPILKMLSRRQPSAISQTLSYITREAGNTDISPILHNLRSQSNDQDAIANEFLVNEAFRKVTSNRIYCYHSILSLSDLDREQITLEMMQTLAKKYFELRGDVLAVAVPHFDTESPHLHILEGATVYRENKSSGLRKQELHDLKMELEGFVEQMFPELIHSKVLHGKEKSYTQEPEFQLLKRTGENERELLKNLVNKVYTTSNSKLQFLETLLNHGYIHYERNSDGIPTGVISESGRKYRFKTLGLSPEKILALENSIERQQEQKLMDQLKSLRLQNNPKNRER